MNRRKFLGVGVGVAAVATIPSSLSAADFRATKPKAWSLMNKMGADGKKAVAADMSGVDGAIKELFGTSATTQSDVKLKAPAIADNGAVVPITVSTKLKASRVAIFQSANPESTVAVFTVVPGSLPEYSVRIKLAQTGTVKVVAEVDGKLYSASAVVKVTAGGCGG